MKRLIKLSPEHYVVVDDSEIKEGDFFIHNSHYITGIYQVKSVVPKSIITTTDEGCRMIYCKKITHSTKSLIGVQFIHLSEVEELVNGYNLEMAAMDYASTLYDGRIRDEITKFNSAKCDYIEGFKAHQELTKDKLFTIEDMKKAISMSKTLIDHKKREFDIENILGSSDNTYGIHEKYDEEDIIKTLLPKVEWLVEFDENGKLKLI